jgi:accessory gene regulator B
LKSGMKCVLFSTSAMTLISLSSFNYKITFSMGIASLFLVGIFAPSNIKKQSRRIPEKDYPRLKLYSLIIVGSNLVIGSPAVASAFLIQSITLLHMKGGEKS